MKRNFLSIAIVCLLAFSFLALFNIPPAKAVQYTLQVNSSPSGFHFLLNGTEYSTNYNVAHEANEGINLTIVTPDQDIGGTVYVYCNWRITGSGYNNEYHSQYPLLGVFQLTSATTVNIDIYSMKTPRPLTMGQFMDRFVIFRGDRSTEEDFLRDMSRAGINDIHINVLEDVQNYPTRISTYQKILSWCETHDAELQICAHIHWNDASFDDNLDNFLSAIGGPSDALCTFGGDEEFDVFNANYEDNQNMYTNILTVLKDYDIYNFTGFVEPGNYPVQFGSSAEEGRNWLNANNFTYFHHWQQDTGKTPHDYQWWTLRWVDTKTGYNCILGETLGVWVNPAKYTNVQYKNAYALCMTTNRISHALLSENDDDQTAIDGTCFPYYLIEACRYMYRTYPDWFLSGIVNPKVIWCDHLYDSTWFSANDTLRVNMSGASGSGDIAVYWETMNSSIKIYNGTLYNAQDYWNSTTKLIEFPYTLASETIVSFYAQDGNGGNGDNVVVLNEPAIDATVYTNNVAFNYTPTFLQTIQNASLWLNISGTWQRAAWNTTVVQNNTQNTINWNFVNNGSATYIWNVEVFNSTTSHFDVANRTLYVKLEPYFGTPSWNTTLANNPCNFTCTVSDGDGLSHGWLETNNTGSYSNETVQTLSGSSDLITKILTLNSSVVVIRVRFFANDSDGLESVSSIQYLTTTETVNWWQMTWNWKDLDDNNVSSLVTWQLWNNSQQLTYTQGQYSLLDGTYTLKALYYNEQINSSSLSTATYGNQTTNITLQMKSHSSVSGGYVIFNNTISSITINSQTSTNLTFTVSGSGSFQIVAKVPKNASYVQKDNVNQTGWVYDSSNKVIELNTSSLSIWEFIFPSESTSPGGNPTEEEEEITYTLTVKVIDTEGHSLSNAKVTVWNLIGLAVASQSTNNDGYAYFDLANSIYDVTAEYKGYSGLIKVQIKGEPVNKTITVDKRPATEKLLSTESFTGPVKETLGLSWFIIVRNWIGPILAVIGLVLALLGLREDMILLKGLGIIFLALGITLVIAIWVIPFIGGA